MSPITPETAFEQTSDRHESYNIDPNAPNADELLTKAREQSAAALVAGVAANDAYWDSRGPLEQIVARAQGHGVVQRGEDSQTSGPALDTQTGPPVIEGREAPATGAGAEPAAIEAASAPLGTVGETAPENPPPAAAPDNPTETVARLRAQLEAANITPEA